MKLRLLLVTYWYPPAVGAAAQRMHAFSRYLPPRGFEVHVLTAERSAPPVDDGVVVHSVEDPLAGSMPLIPDYDASGRSGRFAAMVRDLVFPDRFLHWAHGAIRAGREIIRRHRIDAILVSFPPASAVSTALVLAEQSGLPLVLDVRDRWIGSGGYVPMSASAKCRHRELERKTVAHSAAIITVSEALADAISEEQRFPRERIWVIPNGYDPAEIPSDPMTSAAVRSPLRPAELTIAHVGTVIDRNRPDLFFESLSRLRSNDALKGIRFRFVGNLSDAFLSRAGLTDLVESTGLVPRHQAMEEMRRADALLLLTGAYVGRWGFSAKLFEYLHAGRPILCLEEAPGSNDRVLLEALAPEQSHMAPLDDADAIASALTRLRVFVKTHPAPLDPPPGLARFSRAVQSAELGRRLDQLLKK